MNLPNKLTMFRIILIPVFLLLLAVPWEMGNVMVLGTMIPVAQILAAIVFIIAALTDFLDGQIARKQHLVTNFGKFADPLADKMIVMTAFIMLVGIGSNNVAAWIAAIIVCRELAVTGLRLIIVQNDGEVVAAAWSGKIKTFFEMISIIILLLNNVFFANFDIPVGQICLYIALIAAVYSGIEYFVKNRKVFADSF
ncbi:CDP-diacylglycerol--glycerol-3-phosphate 3-phosphatidyltransferase [Fructilactobacillus lindneri]|uniref:CDP-diacylglycerol--glycerol-3-phosphate 3-phosphatidyltransferase n=2 Tax=Fructilactobacillus lindneri TaxID=53444 RepID=A0A0R2JXI7_9LACO|nr:CDP-diacylglycerol--glycerol-3-phosphate 3-phosphatidyltransferase [Fructilactobacillus lindneri]ANZ58340.1 CDP-diacylglycerol--glycerol-3-phosphate 3-phosphatidyltransferase [Fructilactobacillus lindneri]ANZ59662.1 CDP-diacylglycerol--glycerol-3-phosphate 3-phosphatidyltransferase [Fructilactobacillus lindneri]KRN79175.1 CDP-diacylglycerol--glycerol-3-phosphate 3-phosphatidyltransferase [Fructilactobacillus lindneri DSM 20690 = JCM 11027]POG98554.1 CDP-diacylglycerol--glycerol-3-phosphate 3